MSIKEQSRMHCKEILQNRELLQYYNEADFNHIYRKMKGAFGNPFFNGLNAADFIIKNAKTTTHDRRNEN